MTKTIKIKISDDKAGDFLFYIKKYISSMDVVGFKEINRYFFYHLKKKLDYYCNNDLPTILEIPEDSKDFPNLLLTLSKDYCNGGGSYPKYFTKFQEYLQAKFGAEYCDRL